MSRKFTALGANIFAGLFTKGVQDAGFEVLGQLEHGPYGVATCKLNFPKLDIRVGRENWNEKQYKNKVDFMYCNPPCAAFSTAGKGNWQGQVDRLRYIYDCAEAGINVKPKAWAWESVTQAWGNGRQFVLQIAEMWNDAGYHVTVLLQDNQNLGAPQVRRRMFLIAHKHQLVWPKFTEPMTVGEALKKVAGKKVPDDCPQNPEISPLFKRLVKMSKSYNGYLAHTFKNEGRGGKEGGVPSVMARRLKLDAPAPVMIASHLRFHPTRADGLNWYEWLALCGLPTTWKTSERGMSAAASELARAVLPPVGNWLARAVKEGLKLPPIKGRHTTRVVDMMKPVSVLDQQLFVFDGPTIKPIIPPPIPRLDAPKPGRVPWKEGDPPRTIRAPRAPGKPGSGERIREMLVEGLHPEKILEVIHKEFLGSKASKSDVSWNKGKLRKEGVAVP